MKHHKLVSTFAYRTAALLLALAPEVSAAATTVAPGRVVSLNTAQRAFLVRTARRTISDAVRGLPTYQPSFVPHTLSGTRAEVIIRLRHAGYLLASASAGPDQITQATRDAALTTAQIWITRYRNPKDLLDALLIEVEVVGSPEPIQATVDWTKPRALDPFIEPGVHGIVLLGPTVHQRFTPTELITSDMVLADALKSIAQKTHSLAADVTKTRLMRFRTVHWYQAEPGAPVVSLHRGLTLVKPELVSAEVLDRAIETLGDYMIYRQQPSGLFTYQYEPAWNRYVDEDNLVRQVGATMAMSSYARTSQRGAALSAADAGIAFHLRGLRMVPGRTDAAYIATSDERNKLGVTALLSLALAEHPHADQYAETRRMLIAGMLILQRPSGMFLTAFPPAREIGAQDYFPGEALLAMASHYEHEPSSEVLDSLNSAIRFYRDYFRNRPSPAFVSWQVQAYTTIARQGKRREYVDYVFELTDWLAAKQLSQANCEWPELWGGIASYQPGRAGVSTASYLEGFADALALAREAGDKPRAKRYEKLVRSAARFVLQLQFRKEEAYFVRSMKDTVGAIRTSPSLNLLRIDHCQHALIALIKTRRVLFGDDR